MTGAARGMKLEAPAQITLPLEREDYQRLYRRVRLRLLRILGPCDDLEDVLQTTMERLLTAWAGYRGEGSAEAFADGVALNMARLYLRRRSITRRIFDFFTEPAERWGGDDSSARARTARPASVRGTECEDVDARQCMKRLLEILDGVGPKKRIAFCMFYFEGKQVNCISRELGVNRETVKARIFHARREVWDRAQRDPVLHEWLEEGA